MKYRIILYLFLLGIAAALYFIELESISFLVLIGLVWLLVIVLTSFISTLFKLIIFIGKKVSFFSLFMLSVAEITVMVLFSVGGIYRESGGLFLLLIPVYFVAILGLYSLIDESSGIFSNVFASFVFNSIFFIIIFFKLAHEFHIHIRVM